MSDANLDETLRPYLRLAGMTDSMQDKVIAGVTARLSAAVRDLPWIVREMTPGERPMTTVVSRESVLDILDPRRTSGQRDEEMG